MNPLPPQAYTKDTLVKAYSWLNTQGPSIKEMATTPDILVSLYLKATRDGDSSLDRPSIQNFKNELKSLAGLMGQLDNKSTGASTSSYVTTAAATPGMSTAVSPLSSPGGSLPPPAGASSYIQHSAPTAPTSPVVNPSTLLAGLDALSLSLIQEVKNDLNLSSELEALRMLIKIGHSRTKNLL